MTSKSFVPLFDWLFMSRVTPSHWPLGTEGIYPHPLQEVTPSTHGCQPSDVTTQPHTHTTDWIKMFSASNFALALTHSTLSVCAVTLHLFYCFTFSSAFILPFPITRSHPAWIREWPTCATLLTHVGFYIRLNTRTERHSEWFIKLSEVLWKFPQACGSNSSEQNVSMLLTQWGKPTGRSTPNTFKP